MRTRHRAAFLAAGLALLAASEGSPAQPAPLAAAGSEAPGAPGAGDSASGGSAGDGAVAVEATKGGDPLDRLDDALAWSALHDELRFRISGTLDLEGYELQGPTPALILSERDPLFVPRLSVFLDAQLGPDWYVYVQSRADDGFDPGDEGSHFRLDEYALRFTPGGQRFFNAQVGKFATVVGNWTLRHGSWDNPFITAPLPYSYLTGIWDTTAAPSADALLTWGGLRPGPTRGGAYLDEYRSLPLIWGPSYASGADISGEVGPFDYAMEVKNASLSSRPEVWNPTETQWQHPTWSGRLGYAPDESWTLGFSASEGSYLRPLAAPTLPAGRSLGDYREIVTGQDVAYAWHHFQFWAEAYEGRFEIPGVGPAETVSYYLEARLKFTPQFSGALRWNQQVFGTVPDGAGGSVPWGRNVWRIDAGPAYRFTPHLQVKLQYSLQHEDADSRSFGQMLAGQLTVRF